MKKAVTLITVALFYHTLVLGEDWNGTKGDWGPYQCVEWYEDEEDLTRSCIRWVEIDEDGCIYDLFGYGEEE